jgi:hypothetical protein
MAQFVPPIVDEVRKYARSIGWEELDAQYFVDKMSAVGWVDKQNRQIKDWQAVIRLWFRAAINRGEIKGTSDTKTFRERQDEEN